MRKTRLSAYFLIPATLVGVVWFTMSQVTARPERKEENNPSCSSWLEQTLKSAERVSMLKRRDRIVRALEMPACKAIPESLQRAATAVFQSKDGKDRSALAEAARAVLGPTCQAAREATSAWEVVATCPLAHSDFKIAEGALKDMSVTDYLVLNGLQKSLLVGGDYNQTAELVLRNFSLSAALLGEQARERKQKASPVPGR